MAWTVTPSQTAAPSLICLSEFQNSVKNGALDISPHFNTLQPQCDNCRSDNQIERVLFAFWLSAYWLSAFRPAS